MKSFATSEHLKDLLYYKDIPNDGNSRCEFATRLEEVWRMVHVLMKRKNRNILVWGEFGVGKTHLIEQLIEMVSSQYVSGFQDYVFVELNISALVSKSKEDIHNSFNELRFILERNSKLVLIINNMEILLEYDKFLEIELRQLLTIPGACVIATVDTDVNEISYKPFYNLFWQLHIKEPNVRDVYEIIKYQVSDMERFYNVRISKSVVEWVIYCSKCFSSNNEPKRSIDLIETVMSYSNYYGCEVVTQEYCLDFFHMEFLKYNSLPYEEKKRLAIHELGHFIVVWESQNTLGVTPYAISMIPTNDYVAVTFLEENGQNHVHDKNYYIQKVGATLAGGIAEEIFKLSASSGSSVDFSQASEIAEEFESNIGMNQYLNSKGIDDEEDDVDSILKKGREYAEEVIRRHKGTILFAMHDLTINGVMTGMEIEEIIEWLKN